MFFPYKIQTLFKHWPISNWVIIVTTTVMYFLSDQLSGETVHALVLGGTSLNGLVGHLFLHADFVHLGGNLLFLWVFGNAVCAMTSNFLYPLLYLAFGIMAAAAHMAFDGEIAIGASGAINGIVGMAFAMYPTNRVSVFWFFIVRAGTFEMPLWVLALGWFAFDVFGAVTSSDGVAYWAHLGGFAAGVIAGVTALKLGWMSLTEYDNASLADMIKSKPKRTTGKWAWEEPMNLRD